MPDEIEKIHPDAGSLGEVIIQLNISCRNVMIYPRDHPSIQKVLNRAFNLLQELFDLRTNITFVVGKDALVIDGFYLDRKNIGYRQFAKHLRRLNIAHITFLPGLTIDELYEFQHFISKEETGLSLKEIQEIFSNLALPHIQAGFVDYRAFSFEEGKTAEEIPQEDLWETYIKGIVTGTLKTEEIFEEIEEIPPDIFSRLLNKICKDGIDKTISEKIFAIYIQKVSKRAFSNKEMKKLLDFTNGLQPHIKEQFIDTVVDILSKNMDLATMSLSNISADLVIELFDTIRSQKIAIPECLQNLLDKLLSLHQKDLEDLTLGESSVVDDIFLPSDIVDMFAKSDLGKIISDPFETTESDTYQEEIQKLLEFDASEMVSIKLHRLKEECDDDYTEKIYNSIILELMLSDIVSLEEYRKFIEYLNEQTAQCMWTGQYGQVLQIIKLLRSNVERDKFADITSEALQYYYTQEFFLTLIDSLKIIGRKAKDEAWYLCEYYGEAIIPFLMDSLVNEDSQTFRSLLMSLLRQFGDKIVPEALNRLDDTRWFVKRNMFYLLNQCKSKEIIPHVKPYCRHENPKVSFEAIKCLLNLKDSYGLEVIKEYLLSEIKEEVEQAIALLGAFKVKGAVPDLIHMLRKKGKSKADLSQKILIIQALGNIGDLRSLDAFKEILSSKSLFFSAGLEKLKEEIYKTLKNYHYNDIEDIVQSGLQSRNEYIRGESLRLSKIKAR
jgi:HEAT repeat protein